ncbi:MAG: FAD:protein FMN transferase [Candidatus Gastranaerophilaceae bacterium]|jgi:thiamine biosynthesis lipoprotein|nr:FAD:protein FMN transferase [Christensenellales bacterium]
MKRLVPVLAAALIILSAFTIAGCSIRMETYTGFHMNTYVELSACGKGAYDMLLRCKDRLAALESSLSPYMDGPIHRLNTAHGEWTQLDGDSFYLLELSVMLADATDGAFDPTIFIAVEAWDGMSGEKLPSDGELRRLAPFVDYTGIELDAKNSSARLRDGQMVDLGGIAKGYAANELKKIYDEAGCAGVINLGGNVYAVGSRPDNGPWRIGVQNPRGNGYIEVLELTDKSAVTSGDYQRCFIREGVRYHHILDPDTLKPADSGIISVTVISGDSALADAAATAAVVMGADKAKELAERLGVSALIVTKDGESIWLGG